MDFGLYRNDEKHQQIEDDNTNQSQKASNIDRHILSLKHCVISKKEFGPNLGKSAAKLQLVGTEAADAQLRLAAASTLTHLMGLDAIPIDEVVRNRVAGFGRVQISEGSLHRSHELETDGSVATSATNSDNGEFQQLL
jgi:hypothetical protein